MLKQRTEVAELFGPQLTPLWRSSIFIFFTPVYNTTFGQPLRLRTRAAQYHEYYNNNKLFPRLFIFYRFYFGFYLYFLLRRNISMNFWKFLIPHRYRFASLHLQDTLVARVPEDLLEKVRILSKHVLDGNVIHKILLYSPAAGSLSVEIRPDFHPHLIIKQSFRN